jgi:hypothetical protein
MAELETRPDLPEIFPQDDVLVEGEEHTFKVSEIEDFGTGDDTRAQYEYTLDKAPIEVIQSVQGVDQDGNSRTFNNGEDYELTAKTETVISDYEYEEGRADAYILRYNVDFGTGVVTDDSGDSYTNGTDYAIESSDSHYGDNLVWLDGGDTPEDNEQFTVRYDVTFPTSVLQWQTDADNLPRANSRFYVTYRADSIISRYLDAHEDKLDDVNHALQEVINNKFVDSASAEALDELGKLFGPTIGKRRGRNDQQYRIYLKSVVQSFVSRGTVNGIKLAVSAATDIPIEDIEINEDFGQVQYEIQVQATTPVTVELLEEVAEIADPSGVDQVGTRFVTDPDEMEVNDQLSVTEGQQLFDDMAVADTTANFGFGTEGAIFEDVVTDDGVIVNDNKFVTTDVFGSDDAVLIDPNKNTVPDEMAAADEGVANRAEANETLATDDAFAIDPRTTDVPETVDATDTIATPRGFADEIVDISEVLNVEPSNKNQHRWEDDGEPSTTGWNFFEWTELIELARALSDTAFVDDAATVPPKDAIVSDEFASADSVEVRFNVESVSDTAFLDDAVTIPPKDAITADTSGSADAVTNVSSTLVAWDTNDWGAFDWTPQHN